MVVNNNIPALYSYIKMKGTETKTSAASQKLSSGYKINSAADDASGLAISEKMRAQIRGMNQAERNVQDGISLIQTAEGGMQQITEMIQRQRELVIQGLNDTNTDEDREKIDMEIRQLIDEIDDLARRTDFNRINLLARDDLQILEDRSSLTVDTMTSGPYTPDTAMTVVYDWFTSSTPEVRGTVLSSQTDTRVNDAYYYEHQTTPIVSADGRDGFNDYEKSVHTHIETVTNRTVTEDFEKETNLDYKTLSIYNNADSLALMPKESIISSDLSDTRPHSGMVAGQTIIINGNAYSLASGMTVSYTDSTTMVRSISISGIDIEERVKIVGNNAYEVTYKIVNDSGTDNLSIGFLTDVSVSQFSLTSPTGLQVNSALTGDAVPDSGVLLNCSNAVMNEDISLLNTSLFQKPDSIYCRDMNLPYQQYQIEFEWNQSDLDSGNSMEMGFAFTNIQFKQDVYKTTTTAKQQVHSVTATTTTDIKDIDYIPPRLQIQAGANANDFLNIPLYNMTSGGLGIAHIGLLSPANPDQSLEMADRAIAKITGYRSVYGTLQNRMEYTMRSLQISSENLSAAESRIRDADMAKEMMAFVKGNVMKNTSVAMLTQANQQPQVVLQLLND